MAKYKIRVVTKVAGQPDAADCCECPDEGCFLDCWAAWDSAMSALRTYRGAFPHDSAKGKKVSVCVHLVVTRGGKPHVTARVDLHDFPQAALPQLDKLRKRLVKHPAASRCLVS